MAGPLRRAGDRDSSPPQTSPDVAVLVDEFHHLRVEGCDTGQSVPLPRRNLDNRHGAPDDALGMVAGPISTASNNHTMAAADSTDECPSPDSVEDSEDDCGRDLPDLARWETINRIMKGFCSALDSKLAGLREAKTRRSAPERAPEATAKKKRSTRGSVVGPLAPVGSRSLRRDAARDAPVLVGGFPPAPAPAAAAVPPPAITVREQNVANALPNRILGLSPSLNSLTSTRRAPLGTAPPPQAPRPISFVRPHARLLRISPAEPVVGSLGSPLVPQQPAVQTPLPASTSWTGWDGLSAESEQREADASRSRMLRGLEGGLRLDRRHQDPGPSVNVGASTNTDIEALIDLDEAVAQEPVFSHGSSALQGHMGCETGALFSLDSHDEEAFGAPGRPFGLTALNGAPSENTLPTGHPDLQLPFIGFALRRFPASEPPTHQPATADPPVDVHIFPYAHQGYTLEQSSHSRETLADPHFSSGTKRAAEVDEPLAHSEPPAPSEPVVADSADGDGRRKKSKRGYRATPEFGSKKFACPYFKRNVKKYRKWTSCPGPGWDEVHRVKYAPLPSARVSSADWPCCRTHLYRRHALPIQCPRCWEVFKTDDLLQSHLQQDPPCVVQENRMLHEGFTKNQEKRLRSRKKAHADTSDEAKWREIYMILFPDDDPSSIPSPCESAWPCSLPSIATNRHTKDYNEEDDEFDVQGLSVTENLEDYATFVRREMPTLVRRELEALFRAEFRDVEERVRPRVAEIVLSLQPRLLSLYKQSQTPLSEYGPQADRGTTNDSERALTPLLSQEEPSTEPGTTSTPATTLQTDYTPPEFAELHGADGSGLDAGWEANDAGNFGTSQEPLELDWDFEFDKLLDPILSIVPSG